MQVIFNLTKSFNDKRALCIKTKNIQVNYDIYELFNLLKKMYEDLFKCLNNIDLTPEDFESMNYSFSQANNNKISTYIQSHAWLIPKKCTINPQNKNDNKYFQYAITIALNHQKINNNPERISKIKPFINNLNWDEINFPSQQEDCEKFEANNESIALNVLYAQHNTEDIKHFYKSKFNFTRKHEVTLLMITVVKNGIIWL